MAEFLRVTISSKMKSKGARRLRARKTPKPWEVGEFIRTWARGQVNTALEVVMVSFLVEVSCNLDLYK